MPPRKKYKLDCSASSATRKGASKRCSNNDFSSSSSLSLSFGLASLPLEISGCILQFLTCNMTTTLSHVNRALYNAISTYRSSRLMMEDDSPYITFERGLPTRVGFQSPINTREMIVLVQIQPFQYIVRSDKDVWRVELNLYNMCWCENAYQHDEMRGVRDSDTKLGATVWRQVKYKKKNWEKSHYYAYERILSYDFPWKEVFQDDVHETSRLSCEYCAGFFLEGLTVPFGFPTDNDDNDSLSLVAETYLRQSLKALVAAVNRTSTWEDGCVYPSAAFLLRRVPAALLDYYPRNTLLEGDDRCRSQCLQVRYRRPSSPQVWLDALSKDSRRFLYLDQLQCHWCEVPVSELPWIELVHYERVENP